jgi:ribosomal protein L28
MCTPQVQTSGPTIAASHCHITGSKTRVCENALSSANKHVCFKQTNRQYLIATINAFHVGAVLI